MPPLLTVYYNTRCPVCDAGIKKQKGKLALARAGIVEWRDINLEPEALASHGASLEAIRKRLHAVHAQGNLLVGIDVAIAIFRLTPGQQWLGRLLALPGLHRLAAGGYDGVASALYDWNRRKGHW